MPRGKKAAPIDENTVGESEVKPKRTRKPKVAATAEPAAEPEASAKPKRTRKPKVAPDTESVATESVVTEEPPAVQKKRGGGGRKKAEETPYSSLISNTQVMVHKEATLPTHIENNLEKVDADGYTIEYIRLTAFDVGEVTYYRDSAKNKLYKKLKEKSVGPYVGRWNPDLGAIVSDIPDSDDEN